MFLVLLTVCLYGITFGIIQAADDPENHKCAFKIVFSVAKEIDQSEPIGIAIGMAVAFLIELIR